MMWDLSSPNKNRCFWAQNDLLHPPVSSGDDVTSVSYMSSYHLLEGVKLMTLPVGHGGQGLHLIEFHDNAGYSHFVQSSQAVDSSAL